jgi:hypothetical protein
MRDDFYFDKIYELKEELDAVIDILRNSATLHSNHKLNSKFKADLLKHANLVVKEFESKWIKE